MTELISISIPEYQTFLTETTSAIHIARMRVAQSTNRELISLYWWIGENIVRNQEQYGWGKSIVEQLSGDLKRAFPDAKFGFSPRNLWDMRRFYLAYRGFQQESTVCKNSLFN